MRFPIFDFRFSILCAAKRPSIAAGLLACSAAAAGQPGNQAPAPQGPVLQIETFALTRAFTVGSEPVWLSGTVKNVGSAASAPGAAVARIYALAGLDYTEGDTAPRLPGLEPQQEATFRWRLSPTRAEGPLVASLALEQPGAPPQARVLAIPRLSAAPGPERVDTPKSAAAGGSLSHGELYLENARVRARLLRAEGGQPALLLSSRTPGGWRAAAASLPMVEVCSAEGGQRPWYEQFKLEEARAQNGPASASLALSGSVGLKWRATLELVLRSDSSVMDARLRLSPLRPVRLAALRFCPLLAGAGSFGSQASEALPPSESGPNLVSAVRWGEITVGVLRQPSGPLGVWDISPEPSPREAEYQLFGAELKPRDNPALIAAGALLEVRARLFCMAPSVTVRDAFKVTFPAELAPTPAASVTGSVRGVTAPSRALR